MADLQYDEVDDPDARDYSAGFSSVINTVGAVLSLTLVGGIIAWGYQLTVRDVSGVPVVRALEGPMRVLPENPGGLAPNHQGLSVNHVKAEGEAAPPAQRLILAPGSVQLTEEDKPVRLAQAIIADQTDEDATVSDADTPQNIEFTSETSTDADAQRRQAQNDALAKALAEALVAGGAMPAPSEVQDPPARLASRSGLVTTPRPPARPDEIRVAAPASPPPIELAAADVPPDTRVVQLGAYPTPEAARASWDELTVQFSDFMEGKQRVVQEAESAGRSFYRLRAVGFDDLADARRFCSTLLAAQAACIPVVTR